MVNTISFQFNLIIFREDFSVYSIVSNILVPKNAHHSQVPRLRDGGAQKKFFRRVLTVSFYIFEGLTANCIDLGL